MNILFFLFISFKFLISGANNNIIELKKQFVNAMMFQNLNDQYQYLINNSLLDFLDSFPNFNREKKSDLELYNQCTINGSLFQITEGVQNFLHLLAYSGGQMSDFGQERSCIKKNFSYFLFSYNYILTERDLVYNFLEKNNFYTGICLFNNCSKLLHQIFDNYSDNTIKDIKIYKISNEKNIEQNCEDNLEECNHLPYYTLNENGKFDKDLTLNEKIKYEIFFICIIIFIVILSIEILISIFIYCGYNLYNNSKNFTGQLYEETDLDYDDDDNSEDENEQIIISNSSSSKEKKKESHCQIFVKILYKYFSLVTKVIVLTMRKSKYYNNKNMKTITQLRVISLLLITFSVNFEVYIKIPSTGLYVEYFFKVFYFIFFKVASFGLDIFICLDGFEVMYKLMSYYKKNSYEKANKTITFKGILKFYLFSIYKIIGYFVLFFIVNYFNRYYIYMHKGKVSTYYTYYSMSIDNSGIKNFEIFNPKYSILGYFFRTEIDDQFLTRHRISLLFINEFYIYTIFIIIFYIGDILKSKIFDIAIFLYIFAIYLLSYPLCLIRDNSKVYTYNLIVRNISLIKFPLIMMNHYLLGTFTGLICFYLKESTLNNSMVEDPDKCPFNFTIYLIDFFDFLVQKERKVSLFISYLIQFLICVIFYILINVNEQIVSMELVTSHKIIFYYESGLFIFTFCFNTIFYFAEEIDSKNNYNYNIWNLINQINFSYVNTIYLMIYSYYCYFGFQLRLNYQNLLLISLGLFLLFCFENIIITILFIMPFKVIFKSLLDYLLVIPSNILNVKTINEKDNVNKINNSGLSNELDNNCEEDNESS